MQWPSWLSSNSSKSSNTTGDDEKSLTSKITSTITSPPQGGSSPSPVPTDINNYFNSQTLLPSILLTSTTLGALYIYKTYLRHIPTTAYIKPSHYRNRSLYGYVSSVGDGDNFRLFHTPGGRLAGWGWAPGRRSFLAPSSSSATGNAKSKSPDGKGRSHMLPADQTISVRIAGVDAPEMAHFGRPEQPYGPEALAFLRETVLHRYVRAYIYRRDQYERVVATVYVRRGVAGMLGKMLVPFGLGSVGRKDVGLEMLRTGMATVYEAKMYSEFGGKRLEGIYRAAEAKAKSGKVGLWSGVRQSRIGQQAHEAKGALGRLRSWFGGGTSQGKDQPLETPREYKNRMKALEEGQAAKKS